MAHAGTHTWYKHGTCNSNHCNTYAKRCVFTATQVFSNSLMFTQIYCTTNQSMLQTIFCALQCITVAGGLDVRQDSIWDYRDTVTGPRADTTNVCLYCIDIVQAGKYIAHTNVTGPRAIPAPKSPSLLEVLKVFYISTGTFLSYL